MDGTRYFLDSGLTSLDINEPGDLRKVFNGDLWLRRIQPIRPSNDSLPEIPAIP